MVLTNTWTCILHANESPDAGCFWVPPQCCHFPWKKNWFSSQCCLGLILKFSWEGMAIFTPAWLSICKVVALLPRKWLHSRQLPEELSAQWRQLCQDPRRTEVGGLSVCPLSACWYRDAQAGQSAPVGKGLQPGVM